LDSHNYLEIKIDFFFLKLIVVRKCQTVVDLKQKTKKHQKKTRWHQFKINSKTKHRNKKRERESMVISEKKFEKFVQFCFRTIIIFILIKILTCIDVFKNELMIQIIATGIVILFLEDAIGMID